MNTHNWQMFFDHHATRYMEEPFVKATLAEVDFLVEHLRLRPGMRLLDVGCGTGRHAVELAKRGYQITGIDISSGMLAQAQKAASATGVSIEWIHSPAQDYQAAQLFDALYSVCEGALSLLGTNDPFDRDIGILGTMFTALKPGGQALITVLNGMRFLRMYGEADVASGRFDPLTMTEHGSMEIETSEGVSSIPTRERGYVPTELRMMLQQVGFVVEHIGSGTAGDWRMAPPGLDEMELMALLRRPLAG